MKVVCVRINLIQVVIYIILYNIFRSSFSDNESEAHAAWVKCMEICTKYKLNFDSIPCKVSN